jgi:serine protease Do
MLIAAVVAATLMAAWIFMGRDSSPSADSPVTTETPATTVAPSLDEVPSPTTTQPAEEQAAQDRETFDDEPIAAVAEAVLPAVVQIEARRGGLGSGFVYDPDGFIFTNAHVVGNSETVTVVFQDGTRMTGEVVVNEPAADVAVVQVQARDLPYVPLSNEEPRVGQLAIAMGSPFGLDQTVTAGIVSALDRDVPISRGTTLENAIQTDAAINSGNSGGPLVNRNGEVIGINSAIFTPSGGSDGVGFAIPIQEALAMAAAGSDDADVSGSLESAGLTI